jgi:hypothetical protein
MGICRSKPTSGPVAAGRATSQERPQSVVESRMRSSQSDIKSGEDVASSRHRRKSDRCGTPTTARLTRPPWPGEALQERPQQLAKSSTPLSQKRDIKSVGNGHGGGSNYFSTPTRTDLIPVGARRSNIARPAPTSCLVAHALVPEECYKLGGRRWWKLREQRWERSLSHSYQG